MRDDTGEGARRDQLHLTKRFRLQSQQELPSSALKEGGRTRRASTSHLPSHDVMHQWGRPRKRPTANSPALSSPGYPLPSSYLQQPSPMSTDSRKESVFLSYPSIGSEGQSGRVSPGLPPTGTENAVEGLWTTPRPPYYQDPRTHRGSIWRPHDS